MSYGLVTEVVQSVPGDRSGGIWSQPFLHSVPPTCSEERRQLEPELAFWSKFAGAQAAQVLPLCASMTTVYLFFFVIGRVLTRLD